MNDSYEKSLITLGQLKLLNNIPWKIDVEVETKKKKRLLKYCKVSEDFLDEYLV